MTPTPTLVGRPRRRYRALLGLAVILAGAGLWWGWDWYTRPRPPHVPLDGADPEVAAQVELALKEVSRQPRSAAVWGRLGMTLMANQFEQEAVAPFARAEALDPTDPRWPYLCGVALLGRNPDDALPYLRRAVAACHHPEDREAARLRLAEVLAANGHHDEAAAHFRGVADGPLAPCADYGLAVLASARGDLGESKRLLTRCADSPLTRQKAAIQLAAVLHRLGEKAPDERRTAALPADQPWPDPFLGGCLRLAAGRDSRLRLVNTLEAQGQGGQALEVLRSLVRDYPDAPTFLALGITLGRTGHFQESETALRRCLDLEPRLVRAQYYLSLALFAQGEAFKAAGRPADATDRFEEAARWARRATELAPHNGEAHFQLGLTLWCLERRPDAVAAFRQAVATRPEMIDAHLWLGKTLGEVGEREEALRHLRHAERHAAPDDPRPRKAIEAVQGAKKP